MLRGLVLVLLVLNAGLFFWIRSDPGWTQADREPQRLAQQVSPEAVTFVAEPPPGASGKGRRGTPAAVAPDAAASDATAASPAASAASSSVAAAASAAPAAAGGACLETGAMPVAEAAAIQRAIVGNGVPVAAVSVRADPQPARWIVYMGRFADGPSWQKKADELRKLDLRYAAVTHPAALSPGLSLGSYSSNADAEARLAELARRGVHTARVVSLEADSTARRVQVRTTDPVVARRLPGDRFVACAAN